jgi:hypothetical protein
MAIQYGHGQIVQTGLVLNLDSADVNSYPGSGTTWTDTSGNENSGTLVNGPTYTSGPAGYIATDGTNDYINFGQKFQYQDQFTAECWVRWTSTPTQTGGCGIYAPIFTNKDYGWNINTNGSNTITWNIYNTTGAANSVTTSGAYLNQWVHIVGYKNGVTMGLYINGSSIGTATLSTNSVYYAGYDCTIGGNHPCGGTNYYMGLRMGAARVYNKVLSPTEISQNFNAQRKRYNI